MYNIHMQNKCRSNILTRIHAYPPKHIHEYTCKKTTTNSSHIDTHIQVYTNSNKHKHTQAQTHSNRNQITQTLTI